jgi:FixJ family two-component response regulator
MPNLDGPGLIVKLREIGCILPVLVYSAYRSVKEIAALLNEGADAFLSYPISRENIGEYLERFLFINEERKSKIHEA